VVRILLSRGLSELGVIVTVNGGNIHPASTLPDPLPWLLPAKIGDALKKVQIVAGVMHVELPLVEEVEFRVVASKPLYDHPG